METKRNGSNGESWPVELFGPSRAASEDFFVSARSSLPEAPAPDAAQRTPPAELLVAIEELCARQSHDLFAPEVMLNRELTWLNFNYRVLREAQDDRNPLLERVFYLSVVHSNLDEFFMKRIGGLKQQREAGVESLTLDGRNPKQQIDACYARVRDLEQRAQNVFRGLDVELRAEGIQVGPPIEVEGKEREWVREHFLTNIFPLLTPQATDPAHPFPFISNLSLNLLVSLRYPGDEEHHSARVKVPVGTGLPRFLKLPERDCFLPMEYVIAANLDQLFPGMQVVDVVFFRVTRNANTERDEELADDLLELIETELRDRKFAPVVRLEVMAGISDEQRALLATELELEDDDVFESDDLLGLSELKELLALRRPDLRFAPHHPVDAPEFARAPNLFDVILRSGPVLVSHPYESFASSVERFLEQASRDPRVRAIKMTLYRTSSSSRVVDFLIDAARNGKQVAVLVELKARFDEAANIRWANSMEEAGIHVTYGVLGLKTHCKTLLIIRQDPDRIRRYAHLGTGNYHAGTARSYSDFSLFTCDEVVGSDLTELFNYLTTGYTPRRNYQKLLPAPKRLKPALLERIRREGILAESGREGRIRIKTNALQDVDVIRALYQASQSGARVELLIRDTCCLLPGVPGLSQNIRVISIVGRFLEHARLFYFGNDGDEQYYLGSADCMKRNLESRIEVMVPVEDPGPREILRHFLETQWTDMRNAWEMQPDGSYVQRVPDGDSPDGRRTRGSQERLVQYFEVRAATALRLRRRGMAGPERTPE